MSGADCLAVTILAVVMFTVAAGGYGAPAA